MHAAKCVFMIARRLLVDLARGDTAPGREVAREIFGCQVTAAGATGIRFARSLARWKALDKRRAMVWRDVGGKGAGHACSVAP